MTDASDAAARPRLGVCQSILRNDDMATDLDIAVAAASREIGVFGPMLRRTGIDETARLLRDRALVASSYHPGMRILEQSDADAEAELRTNIEVAAALGAAVVMVSTGSANGLSTAEADDILVTRLSRGSLLAGELGVVMALEPVHPILRDAGYIHTLRHRADIVQRTERVALTHDVVHTYWDRHIFDDIDECVDVIATVHVGNLSGAAMRERRWERAPVDAGVVPVAETLRALHEAGFRGPYENEVRVPTADRTECVERVRAARDWFDAVWIA